LRFFSLIQLLLAPATLFGETSEAPGSIGLDEYDGVALPVHPRLNEQRCVNHQGWRLVGRGSEHHLAALLNPGVDE